MNKFKNIFIPLIFLVLTSTILMFGFYHTGILPELSISKIELPTSGDIVNSETDNYFGEIKSNSTLIEELRIDLMNNGVHKNTLSSDMIGLWVNINKDFSFEDKSDVEGIINTLYSDFNYYRNFLPDTIFIRADSLNEFSGLKDSNGNDFDILSYVLYYTKELKCDAVFIADESIIFDKQGEFTTDLLNKYLSVYGFEGVLLSCESLFGNEALLNCAENIQAFLTTNYPKISFGVEVKSDAADLFADAVTISIFEKGLCDFGYVDCNYATKDANYPFYSVSHWWNSFADHYNVPLYCEHRADKVFTDADLWGHSSEISDQMKALYTCPAFEGSCFYSISSVKNKRLLARDLSIFINDVAETIQDSMSVESLVIDSVTNEVSFSGKATEGLSVYCGKDEIANNEGAFSVKYPLDSSVNTFDFSCNGAKYSYVIENNMHLMTSYYPSESVLVNKNSTLHTHAVSPSDSKLFTVINGNVFSMSPYTAPEGVEVPAGYTYFTCDISLEKMDFESAELSIFCYNNGNYFTADCGYVSQTMNIPVDSSVNQSGSDQGNITPYTDNGLGTAVLCRINYENTEQIGKSSDYDTYKAYNSALLKGTIDYLKNIDVTSEGNLVYEFMSGINVYAVNCTLINNGYNMPLNNISLASFDDTSTDSTSFTFNVDWLSPITVSPQMLDYKVGYRNFSFNIDQFNAQYVDINFYHSAPFNLTQNITFAQNSVFSSYELYAKDNNIYILRLYLKNPGAFYGYDLLHNYDGTVSVVFRKRTDNLLQGKTVMLDPGHGGISMVGTAVSDNSVSEAQVTLNIALYTKKYLEEMGATVLMTRTADTSLPLSARAYMCETQNPDIFVSIHCDGSEAKSESGTHTFYFTPFSQPLAKWIHASLVKSYSEKIYSAEDVNYSKIDRKIKYYPFYVTRIDNCPSVLVETGFMTNYTEGNILINPTNQDILAAAIAQGISDYFYYS